jgi:uncharacterized protein (TIRG00374 family)
MISTIRTFLTSNDPTSVKKRNLATVVFFAALVILLVFILPWKEIFTVFHSANLELLIVAYLVTAPPLLFSAFSFKVIADQQEMGLSAFKILAVNLIISFYQLFIPASIFGSGLRWYQYSKYSKKPVQSLSAIAYYKLVYAFLTILISFSFLLFLDTATFKGRIVQVVLVIIAIAAIILLTPFFSKVLLSLLIKWEILFSRNRFLAFIYKYSLKMLSAFTDFGRLKLKHQLQIILYELVGQSFFLVGSYLMATSLGIDLSFVRVGAIVEITVLVSSLPVNFSPAVGLNDVSLLALLTAAGVDLNHAIAMSLAILTRRVIYSLVGGIIETQRFFNRRVAANEQ